MLREVSKTGFAIQIQTFAAHLIFVLFQRQHAPKKLLNIVRSKSWGWGGNLCLSNTFISSLPSLSTISLKPLTPSAHIWLPHIHRGWKDSCSNTPDIPILALILINSLFSKKQNVSTWLSAWAALWGFYSFPHSCAPCFDAAVHAACSSHSLALGNVTFKCIFIFKLTSPRLYSIKEVLPKNMLLSIYKMKHMPPKVMWGGWNIIIHNEKLARSIRPHMSDTCLCQDT